MNFDCYKPGAHSSPPGLGNYVLAKLRLQCHWQRPERCLLLQEDKTQQTCVVFCFLCDCLVQVEIDCKQRLRLKELIWQAKNLFNCGSHFWKVLQLVCQQDSIENVSCHICSSTTRAGCCTSNNLGWFSQCPRPFFTVSQTMIKAMWCQSV